VPGTCLAPIGPELPDPAIAVAPAKAWVSGDSRDFLSRDPGLRRDDGAPYHLSDMQERPASILRISVTASGTMFAARPARRSIVFG